MIMRTLGVVFFPTTSDIHAHEDRWYESNPIFFRRKFHLYYSGLLYIHSKNPYSGFFLLFCLYWMLPLWFEEFLVNIFTSFKKKEMRFLCKFIIFFFITFVGMHSIYNEMKNPHFAALIKLHFRRNSFHFPCLFPQSSCDSW